MSDDPAPDALVPDEPGHALTIVADSSALVATITGRIDAVEPLIEIFLRIGAEAKRTGLRQVLVLDHTQGVVPPETQLRRMFDAVEGRGLAQVRLAYVDARGTAISRMELGEILGRERGYDCRVFDNESRARIWLHYGEG